MGFIVQSNIVVRLYTFHVTDWIAEFPFDADTTLATQILKGFLIFYIFSVSTIFEAVT